MRVINVSTCRFEEFYNTTNLEYAIISHTWRENEIPYSELLHSTDERILSKKMRYLFQQARQDEIDYIWIDTACIDKSSSAELSEAINSMYQWYKDAKVCYVYLDDVSKVEDIKTCRWITRGWTLQEFIAPSEVRFYSSDWKLLGSKRSLAMQLSSWTGVDHVVLRNKDCLMQMSVATRMSWAAHRQTTRLEDQAYCLLGIFGVNMPLLYGEGSTAFMRLQEEIIKHSNDQSILAWNRASQDASEGEYLASAPFAFRGCKMINGEQREHMMEYTKGGLRLSIQLQPNQGYGLVWGRSLGVLACRPQGDLGQQIAIALRREATSSEWEIDSEYYGYQASNPVVTKSRPSSKHQEILLISAKRTSKMRWQPTRTHLSAYRSVCIINGGGLTGFEVIYRDSANGLFNEASWVAEAITEQESLTRTYLFINRLDHVGFMVQLHDVALRLVQREILYLGHVQPYLKVSSKPSGIESLEWIDQQMSQLDRQAGSHSIEKANLWISRPALELHSSAMLQNMPSTTYVDARATPVEADSSTMIAAWRIEISIKHGSQKFEAKFPIR